MIDVVLLYAGYCFIVTALIAVWFSAGEWLLDRRDLQRQAREIADLLEHEAAERDHAHGTRHLRLVERDNVVDARDRFAARRAVTHYPTGGAA